MRALSLPGCACRAAFQFAVMARLAAAGERFDVVAGASSGSLCGAISGPDMARDLAGSPIVSTRYLATERSVFGMGRILRETLERYLPEGRLQGTEAELLVATTHAGAYVHRLLDERLARLGRSRGGAPRREPLVIHSNRDRGDLHEVLLASCYLPVLHAGLTRLDGAVHLDGALADNTLLDALVARGALDITVVTPFAGGAVARTMFATEGPLRPRPDIRLRVIYPERPLSIGRFDFSRERLEQALRMPHRELILDAVASGSRSA